MATLITGLGLVGTSYAQNALKRGESINVLEIKVLALQRPIQRQHF